MRSRNAACGRAPRPSAPAWLPWSAGSLLALSGLFVLYLRQAQTWRPDSAPAAISLQAWDMLHGNLLLPRWWVSDVSFFTTGLPEDLLGESVRRLRPHVRQRCAGDGGDHAGARPAAGVAVQPGADRVYSGIRAAGIRLAGRHPFFRWLPNLPGNWPVAREPLGGTGACPGGGRIRPRALRRRLLRSALPDRGGAGGGAPPGGGPPRPAPPTAPPPPLPPP